MMEDQKTKYNRFLSRHVLRLSFEVLSLSRRCSPHAGFSRLLLTLCNRVGIVRLGFAHKEGLKSVNHQPTYPGLLGRSEPWGASRRPSH
jgi:hypothetical protein